ncbi:tannase/feruloyl esterase family alpha/beta hydrolase [Kitasatospora sp. NPDC001683]
MLQDDGRLRGPVGGRVLGRGVRGADDGERADDGGGAGDEAAQAAVPDAEQCPGVADPARTQGTRKVDGFYRLFLAPGVDHCGLDGGKVDDLAALTAWVEQGKAPAVLHAP